jgi:glutaminyl-tRNA synthetase
VLDPIKVVITNWPEGHMEQIEAVNNPEDESAGTRTLTLGHVVWIERDDFRKEAPRKFHRLKPGGEVRLRYGFVIRCDEVLEGSDGRVTELRCTYDPESGGGQTSDGRKVKGIVHWVAAHSAIEAEVRLYDRLFTNPDPTDVEEGQDWKDNLNPESLVTVKNAKLEPCLREALPGQSFQFERTGYFTVDTVDSVPGKPVFNRTVALRDSWAKMENRD